MLTARSLPLSCLLFLGLFFCVAPPPVIAQKYTITDLGSPGDGDSRANAINNNGDVTGSAGRQAFLFSQGQRHNLGSLLQISEGMTLNDDDEIIGKCWGNLGNEAIKEEGFVYSQGKMVAFKDALPPTSLARVYSVSVRNDKGLMLGLGEYYGAKHGTDDGTLVAVICDHGRYTVFNHLGDLAVDLNKPLLLNNLGHVAGTLSNGHVFLYVNGNASDLGTLPGTSESVAAAMNDKDEITGYSNGPSGADPTQLFLSTQGKMRSLGVLARFSSVPIAVKSVNSQEAIVVNITDRDKRPYLFQDGHRYDLNDLLDVKSGWMLEEACGINDSGRIAGTGTHNGKKRAFLMTPRP